MIWSLNLISIGVFNGLILSFLFLRKKGYNFYFGFFLLIHSLILLKYIGNVLEFYQSLHSLTALAEILEWLVGPFLYFYVTKYNGQKIKYQHLHFLPIAFYIFILIPVHIYMIRNPDSELFQYQIQKSDFNFLIIPKIALGYGYILFSYRKTIGQRWLSLVVSVYLAEILALTLYYFQFLIFENDIISDLLVSSVMTVSVNVIAISGLMKSSIFIQSQPEKPPEKQAVKSEDKRILEEVFQKVKTHVEQNKVYLNPQIRLSELAEVLKISEKQISQSVNECAGENINVFINRYRIKIAEGLLADKYFSNYTIDAISEECGFSNKVSFYKAFKKIHNMSPREYKESITPQN